MRFLVVAGVVGLFLLVATIAFDWNLGDLFRDDREIPEGFAEPEEPAKMREIRELGLDQRAIDSLSELLGSEPRNLFARGGESPMRIGLEWSLAPVKSREAVARARELLEDPHYRLFFTFRAFGTDADRVGLVKARDPFEPVRLQGTAGESNERLVERLSEWKREGRLDLVGAGTDWVEVEFAEIPSDLDRVLREARQLAPAAFANPEATRATIRRTRRLLLWWE